MAIETRAVDAAEAEWVAQAMEEAAALKSRLDDPIALAALAAKLDVALQGLNDVVLVPASTSATRIIGAAAPRVAAGSNGPRQTVIVEGFLATGVQVVRAARAQGPRSAIKAIAVRANPAAVAFVASELGVPVVVLEP